MMSKRFPTEERNECLGDIQVSEPRKRAVLREYHDGEVEKYLSTQHERDQETGLDYRGARFYDSDVARFLSLDPLAADFAGRSAYNYVLGNPVFFVDPDGRSPNTIIGEDGNPISYEIDKETGEAIWSENTGKDEKRLGNALLKTQGGKDALNNMINSQTPFYLDENERKNSNGRMAKLSTYSNTKTGKITRYKITAYTGNIAELVDAGGVKPTFNSKDGGTDEKQAQAMNDVIKKLDRNDAIYAIGAAAIAHEVDHTDKDNITQEAIANVMHTLTGLYIHFHEQHPETTETRVLKQTLQNNE